MPPSKCGGRAGGVRRGGVRPKQQPRMIQHWPAKHSQLARVCKQQQPQLRSPSEPLALSLQRSWLPSASAATATTTTTHANTIAYGIASGGVRDDLSCGSMCGVTHSTQHSCVGPTRWCAYPPKDSGIRLSSIGNPNLRSGLKARRGVSFVLGPSLAASAFTTQIRKT